MSMTTMYAMRPEWLRNPAYAATAELATQYRFHGIREWPLLAYSVEKPLEERMHTPYV